MKNMIMSAGRREERKKKRRDDNFKIRAKSRRQGKIVME